MDRPRPAASRATRQRASGRLPGPQDDRGHFLADLTLPYGHVLYDYNKDE